jgi:ribonuclease P protein component
MIGRTNRFHGRGGIQRLQKSGKSVRSGAFALRYEPGKRKSYRLAVVVSRKVSKHAVVRNRIRRRLYELVRILSSEFTAPYDLILVVYDEQVAVMLPEELQAEVQKLVQKAKLTSADTGQHAIVDPKE